MRILPMKLRRILCLLLAGLIMITLVQPVAVSAAHENTYVNTGNYRADMIGVARTQVGYRETYDNNTKYGKWYGYNYYPWCAMFVSWCARQAEIPKSVVANSSFAEPSEDCFNLTRKDGNSYTPVPGDLFFTRSYSHTGLVFHVAGDYFYAIEGNTNNNGSDNGTHVMVLKRKISDYYFGTYANSNVAAPAAPTVRTDKNTYSAGQTIRVTWDAMSGAESYGIVIYKNGLIYCSSYTGTDTFYDFKYPEGGEYLISVAAKYANGTTGYGQHVVNVSYAPTLTVRYNANGGMVSTVQQYVVVGGDGTDFHEFASTESYKYGVIPTGTLLKATQLQESGGRVWAEVGFNGYTGWCIVSQGYCERAGYAQTETGEILQYSKEGMATTTWTAGSGEKKALLDPQTAGLTKKNYTFAGWSRTPDGSGTIFRQDQTDLTAEQIEESFAYSNMTVKMYAIWRENVSEISIATLPDQTEYFLEDKLDTTGLTIRVKYHDGTEEVVSTDFTVTGFDASTVGTKQVTVSYYGAKTTFDVTVNARMQYNVENGYAVITDYTDHSGVVIIPDALDGVPVKEIAPGAFADCGQITGITIPASVTRIGRGAFAGCGSLSAVNFTGTKAQWDAMEIEEDNQALTKAALTCKSQVLGDFTEDGVVDNNDVILLLKHSLAPNRFPITADGDLNMDGIVDNDDVILLLKHSLAPDRFPLPAAMGIAVTAEPDAETGTEIAEESAEEPTEVSTEEPAEEPAQEPTEDPQS